MFIKPNERDLLPLFGLAFPYIYLMTLIVIPWTYRYHKLSFVIGLLLLIFGARYFLAYASISMPSKDSSKDLTVLSLNAMMGFKMVSANHQVTSTNQTILNNTLSQSPAPSIICLQEASKIVKASFNQALDDFSVHKLDDRRAMILSKHPIVDRGQVDFGSTWKSCLWADLKVNEKDTIRVYSIHLESNRLNPSSYDLLIKEEEYESMKAIEGIKDLIVKYPLYAARRGQQADLVKTHIDSSPYPVIVCGDFNDPPMSYTYRQIKSNLCDTFLKSGSGIGTTLIGAIPMLRIDYIFASKEIKNTGFTRLDSDLSDHYPIKATFTLN